MSKGNNRLPVFGDLQKGGGGCRKTPAFGQRRAQAETPFSAELHDSRAAAFLLCPLCDKNGPFVTSGQVISLGKDIRKKRASSLSSRGGMGLTANGDGEFNMSDYSQIRDGIKLICEKSLEALSRFHVLTDYPPLSSMPESYMASHVFDQLGNNPLSLMPEVNFTRLWEFNELAQLKEHA